MHYNYTVSVNADITQVNILTLRGILNINHDFLKNQRQTKWINSQYDAKYRERNR